MKHLFPYKWRLKETSFAKNKGKVFSCFACGGGSTMGYKLAGFDVIGCNEIDPRMMEAYIANHQPKYSYLEPIQEFKLRDDLPQDLYDLDILDGSPPCSSFSIAGNREKDWGKMKKFTEGQAKQVLDTLFFDFIDLANKLRPKIVVAENVEGIIKGKAIGYVVKIYDELNKAGYHCQHFLLNSATMGVPQKRSRVFFVAVRKDLVQFLPKTSDLFTTKPLLKFDFKEPLIPFCEVKENNGTGLRPKLYPSHEKALISAVWGDSDLSASTMRTEGKKKYFNNNLLYDHNVCGTITAHKDNASHILFNEKRYLSEREIKLIGSYPLDYNFLNHCPGYLVGMSVPPLMTAHISTEIHKQWLSRI